MKFGIYIILLFFQINTFAFSTVQCTDILSVEEVKTFDFENLNTANAFFEAMTKGMLVDVHQEALFMYYRTVLGDQTKDVGKDIATVHKFLDTYPSLISDKIVFREIDLKRTLHHYPVLPEVSKFVQSLLKSTGQIKGNLFNIDANLGFWKKMLMPPVHQISKLSKERKRELSNQFQQKLDLLFPQVVRDKLKNTNSGNFLANTIIIHQSLVEHEQMLLAISASSVQITHTRQAIVDLIHVAPFFNRALLQSLKSDSGLEVLEALSKVFDLQDEAAIALGYAGHYQEVLNKLQSKPSGLDHARDISETLRSFEVKTKELPIKGASSELTRVRPLSILESPFRSCLGGSDCSSRTYFDKALDPNFYYFTMTDSKYRSTGHITLVLGEAKNKLGESAKIAFIDKIQNIPNETLPTFLEAVRLSVLEKGYILAMPTDIGDHNGLSNINTTRDFVQSELIPKYSSRFSGFHPFLHNYDFRNAFSRAYDKIDVLAVSPMTDTDDVFLKGNFYPAFNAPEDLNIETLLNEVLILGRSQIEEDIVKFISLHGTIELVSKYGFNSDQYWKDIENLFYNTKSNTVKKHALYALILSGGRYDLLHEKYFKTGLWQQIKGEIRQWKKSSNPMLENAGYNLEELFVQNSSIQSDEDIDRLVELPWFNVEKYLKKAADDGDIEVIEMFFKNDHFDINAGYGEVIYEALASDNTDIVLLFIEQEGLDANVFHKRIFPLLLQRNEIPIVKALLKNKKFNINEGGRTALEIWIDSNNHSIEMLQAVIDHIKVSKKEFSELAGKGLIDALKIILDKKNIEDTAIEGALLSAKTWGEVEVTTLLEEHQRSRGNK